ncbi:MAG: D-alanyl-D-alanine carboxypeptidase family protein [Pseudomonadales bacterium]|nr:D-alanyl-D-alanine carboxypeptidase family protein [Pseudomonadales bacterium]
MKQDDFTLISEPQQQALTALGITSQILQACRLPYCGESDQLVPAGEDVFGRPQQMTSETLTAWQSMQAAASEDGIVLQLVSAWRSFDYQVGLLQRKLDAGQTLSEILKVSAIPGFSEHHTGEALDLTTPGYPVLDEAFETSPAFAWLSARAADFDFFLSYPRDNDLGIIYEPWHWRFRHSQD